MPKKAKFNTHSRPKARCPYTVPLKRWNTKNAQATLQKNIRKPDQSLVQVHKTIYSLLVRRLKTTKYVTVTET